VFILNTHRNTNECYGCYAGVCCEGVFYINEPFAYKECCGLATEEEKQELFDAIQDNGYKWNEETKTLEKLVEPKFNVGDKIKDTMEENLTVQDIRDNNAEWLLNKLREMSAADTLRTISDLYDELHKPQYPKTYEECRKMFGIPKDMNIEWQYPIFGYKIRLLVDLQKLLTCRDAFWRIAGEQMKLGKLWEPDWSNDLSKYYISFYNNKVDKGVISYSNKILAFPTKEMRDAFYENFKDLIESCKELL
jgi:hypothetical protein